MAQTEDGVICRSNTIAACRGKRFAEQTYHSEQLPQVKVDGVDFDFDLRSHRQYVIDSRTTHGGLHTQCEQSMPSSESPITCPTSHHCEQVIH